MKMIRARRTRVTEQSQPPNIHIQQKTDDQCCASPKTKNFKIQSTKDTRHLTIKQMTLHTVFARATRNNNNLNNNNSNSKGISSYLKKEKNKINEILLCENDEDDVEENSNSLSDDNNEMMQNINNFANDFTTTTSTGILTKNPINFMGLIPTIRDNDDCNIFLQEPVLSLNIDKTPNQASSIIIKKSLELSPNFGSNNKITLLQTNQNNDNDGIMSTTTGSTIIPLDLSKPTQSTEIDSTTCSDSNSCDSGVVTDKSYDMSPRRRKPATPHRIVCPSPIKNIHTNNVTDIKNINIKSKKRLNVNQSDNIIIKNEQIINEIIIKTEEQNINYKNQSTVKVKENTSTSNNKKLTEFFALRRSVRKTKKEVQDEKNKSIEQAIIERKENDLEVRIFGEKGRGVVTLRSFERGEFVIEYVGELISSTEAQNREEMYAQDQNMGCYMYYFKFQNQQYCIDATAESGHLGRLVNHSRNGNLIPRKMMIKNIPRLVLFAKDDIQKGEEITYDYGDRSKEALIHHPWLAL